MSELLRTKGATPDRLGILAACGVLSLLCGHPAWAAGDAAHGPTTMELVWQAVNLVTVLAVIIYLARKPVAAFFSDRRTGIKSDIDGAAELLQQAETQYTEWQRKLIDLTGEMDEIREGARQRAEDERDQILAEARDTADRIRRDAVAAVDQELRRARAELRQEAADLAVDFADKLLQESVNDGDRDRLLDEFITRVEPGTSPSGTGR
ncbi:MAG: F0F1 ATP synthase subunit B [Deltaproteobacteria bacterium]|nr:F0F1 ATP synthase subunit B [Deltaproteobacteria bacterium]MBW2421401.1 F0F1 ATP synthase subunit B [Deltaproteobacteria bacterium]